MIIDLLSAYVLDSGGICGAASNIKSGPKRAAGFYVGRVENQTSCFFLNFYAKKVLPKNCTLCSLSVDVDDIARTPTNVWT